MFFNIHFFADIRSTLTGIICDLSGSMRKNAGDQINEEGGTWARSMFNVIDDLIKNDVTLNDLVFAVGIGASCRNAPFDVIATTEKFKDCQNIAEGLTHDAIVQKVFDILQNGGARNIRKWATQEVVLQSVSYDMSSLFLNMLGSDSSFLESFVNECLPSSCRNWNSDCAEDEGKSHFFEDLFSSVVTSFRQASTKDIEDVVKKAKNQLLEKVVTVFTVQNASDIIHGSVGQTRLTNDRVKDLMKMIEPFIYGHTPLYKSLKEAVNLFRGTEYKNSKKQLFILSDGKPSDEGSINKISKRFSNADVTIVSCFINKKTDIESKKLFCKPGRRWSDGARFLFDLCSSIPTQRLPRTIFVKRGWKIDISNNHTKLFMQVNDPENIHEACELAKNIVCCQDALSDLLVSVSLDMYINQVNSKLKAPMQDKESCYANASATVVHLSMKRVLGRVGGYPDFYELRQDIINEYGKQEANTLRVLREICPLYRLQCNDDIGIENALKAISEKRPVVATFGLTDLEWSLFNDFFNENPTEILNKTFRDISKRTTRFKLIGHAVVLTSYNSECLHFMNSWGDEWADMGFFRVQNADVLEMKFIDVFWTSSNLTSSERKYFKNHGQEVADNLMKKLVGLQTANYECPLCHCSSLVIDFKGTLHEAICPNCSGKFKCNESGNILAMNIYLTSCASK